ncbi:phosphodiester glycosidase family protein [Legionella israelensis]|uniref:Phosphodiester glycosidase domain-containing protein n=1 Tax=Legionella israelensis TaxID=454 RepID=A0A0W0VK59_9GAMM|nr:phosphodiester glycosidase family protein [Legionella israelensis]KTD20491.1 hypothetical protein Lisr_1736 [Legionella israelensis]QBS10831.1 phosphodiester glycosidase family protein [Legionella israelensis]SCX86394.1 Predicted protein [Legionella israelensis DSM 19235]STX57808.1 Exopolysaccharide biosynthesis protein related to N-acetylglucosamine-1-phosphodiester alpha-N-acetylglucosaminidase [Legionella israelensis]
MSLQTKVYPIKFIRWIGLIPLFFLLSPNTTAKVNTGWLQIKEGIEYRDLGDSLLKPWSHIHIFRIDLRKNQLGLITANALSQKNAPVSVYAHFSQALLAVNGGFFDREYRPLGLRISNKQQKNPLKRISWWGIFYVKKNRPYISNVYHFYRDKAIDFAIQSGPRLIINNKIPSLKPGIAERTALGITKDKKIIILVTDNATMTTTELAEIMKSPPLSCTDALNLDGGKSTQLYANIDSFQLSVQGYSNVSDAVIVKEK